MPENTTMPRADGGVPQVPRTYAIPNGKDEPVTKNTAQSFQDKPISSERSGDLVGVSIHPVPKPKLEIGVDRDGTFYDNMVEAGKSSQIDMTTLDSFLNVAQGRERLYELIDTMTEDPTIAAVLETYAEDATETNDHGKVIWCESDDENAAKMVNFLLDSLNVDKHAFGWVIHLCKYGDLYLRLFRESDFVDALFDDDGNKDRKLNEDVIVNMTKKSDKYVHYVERVANPAEIFELTKFGKTYAYIKADVTVNETQDDMQNMYTGNRGYNKYRFNKKDVNIYQPTEFVHAYLEDDTTREEEEVDIFLMMIWKMKTQQNLLIK